MAEKWEITNRELLVFFGSVIIALFIMAGATAGWFDHWLQGLQYL